MDGREYTLGCELKLFSHLDRIHYFFFSQVNIPLCTSPSLSLTWENSSHFVPPLVSLKNDIREMSAEITTQIWVALLIGWKFASSFQKYYLDRVSDPSSVWSFCAHFSDVISRGDHCLLSPQATLSFITTNLYMYNEVFLYWHPRIWQLYHLSHSPDIYMYDSTALNFLYSNNYTIIA